MVKKKLHFFRRGCRCWIPLDVSPIVVLQFIENSQEQVEVEITDIKLKLQKYVEKATAKNLKWKIKRNEWRKEIRKISDAKKEKKNEKTRKKLLKMSLKKGKINEERERKKAEKKDFILKNR